MEPYLSHDTATDYHQDSSDHSILLRKTTTTIEELSEEVSTDKHNIRYHLPAPRRISNVLCQFEGRRLTKENLSDFMWAWGQFIEHELSHVPINPQEKQYLKVRQGDDIYPQGGFIPFYKSATQAVNKDGKTEQQQVSDLRPFIDGSNIYGNTAKRQDALRLHDGTGQLAFQRRKNGDFPIMNEHLHDNEQAPPTALPNRFFLMGDTRANQNIILTSIHVLFMREHNRLCEILVEEEPHLKGDDEAIYSTVKKVIVAIMQHITYNEYLPALLGKDALSSYQGYQPNLEKGIENLFATACFKLTPALLPSVLLMPNNKQAIQMHDAQFNPEMVLLKGIEPILQGRYQQKIKQLDLQVADEVRTNLRFKQPNSQCQTFYDEVAIIIQRGRDHKLCDYNAAREAYGLSRLSSFDEITQNKDIQDKLASLYADVDCIDPWVGALAEDIIPGKQVGALLYVVIKEQFELIRDSDKNWYQNNPELEPYQDFVEVKLSDVIKRNTLLNNVPINAFQVSRRKRHVTRYS